MKVILRYTLLQIHLIVFLLISCNAFSNEKNTITSENYQELCEIYNSATSKLIDLSSKEMLLASDIKRRLPNIFDNLFTHVMTSDAIQRYKLIKQYAKQQNNIIWTCKSAKRYYDDEF